MVKKQSKLPKSSSEIQKIEELLKDLFILELGRSGFGRGEIRGVLGKIDNTRISRILSTLKKVRK